MGILDVIGDAAKAAGNYVKGVGEEIAGGAQDIVVDGAWGLVRDLTVDPMFRRDQSFSEILNNIGGDIGSLVGGAERIGLSETPHGAATLNETLNTAYREGVDQPLAKAVTAVELASDRHYSTDKSALFQGKTWSDANKAVNKDHRSFGQAVALMFTDDPNDEQEVAKFKQGQLYQATSSTIDAVAPFLLDPALPALRATKYAHTSLVTKPIKVDDDIAQIAASKRVQNVVSKMEGKDAAQIRDEFFPNHPAGAQLADVLASAPTAAVRTSILRGAMGDLDEVNKLQRYGIVYANKVRRLQGDIEAMRSAGWTDRAFDSNGQMYLLSSSDEMAKMEAELDTLYNLQHRNERRLAVHAQITAQPRMSAANSARVAITRSDWYSSGYGAPLRVVFRNRPHGIVNLDDPTGDIQVGRLVSHSALPLERQDFHRTAYIGAKTGLERQAALTAAEDEAIASILDKHGITEGDRKKIMDMASKGRAETADVLRSRAYDGQGRSTVKLHGDGPPTHLPLMVSQNANVMALTDLTSLERIAKRYAPRRNLAVADATTGIYDLTDAALATFYKAWKPAVLLRVAYPIRVVGEEQLRLMSMFGALSTMRYVRSGIANLAEDRTLINGKLAARRAAEENRLQRALTSGELKALRKEVAKDYETNERVRGFRNLEIDGYQVEPALGGRGRVFNSLIDARASFNHFFGRDMDSLGQKLKNLRPTGEFKDGITPDSRSWSKAWLDAVNRQIGQDVAARKILAGQSDEAILSWTQSPEGAGYMRELQPYWRRNPEEWLGNLRGQVESYLPTRKLAEAALERKASLDLAVKEMPEASTRPIVHGEILSQHMAGDKLVSAYNNMVAKGFNALASAPTNILSRNPAFNHVYANEMRRQIELHTGQAKRKGDLTRITNSQIARYEHNARNAGLREVRKNLYDLAEESDLAHILRYISPFYGAWQEVLQVWGGLTLRNPAFTEQLRNLWEAPDRAGLTVPDEQGKEHILIPVPHFLREHWFFNGALKDISKFDVSKNGLNLILQGTPGVGPIVALPTYEVTKDRPDLASTKPINILFPYGVPKSGWDAVLPTTVKNLMKADSDVDAADTRNWYMRIYMTQMTDYRLGKRSTQPDPAEVYSEAKALQSLKVVTAFISPAPTTFQTPYQTYIDAYRRLRTEDPQHADEKFYDTYGAEFYGLTVSLSKSVNGVPPTLEAWRSYGKHKKLLAEHPDLGALIIGAEGAGEFNRYVYQFQKTHRVGPGDSRFQREDIPLEEAVLKPDVNAGWLEFTRAMTIIDAEMERRGLTNIQQKQAADLREMKRNVIAGVAKQYPAWFEAFNISDGLKWTKRIDALTDIAHDPTMTGRQDMEGLREYLDIRSTIVKELSSRSSSTLTAKGNQDIADVWAAATSDLVRRNPAFSSLYYRWLANDQVEGTRG